METFWNKISLTGYKLSNLNVPGNVAPVSHSLLCESLFPIFSPCCFLPSYHLLGNKKLDLPVWRTGRWKNWGTKSAEQHANGPFLMPQVLKPLCLIHFCVNPFSPISAPAASFLPISWVIRNWTSQYERQEGGKIREQNLLNRLQMVQFECPKYWNPCVSFTFVWIPFSHFQPLLLSFFLSLG